MWGHFRWVVAAAVAAAVLVVVEAGSRGATGPPTRQSIPPIEAASSALAKTVRVGDLVRYEHDGSSGVWRVAAKIDYDAGAVSLRRGEESVLASYGEILLVE